jgi:hypothetical protein
MTQIRISIALRKKTDLAAGNFCRPKPVIGKFCAIVKLETERKLSAVSYQLSAFVSFS